MINGFKTYNKEKLFELINAIDISKVGSQIVTKYFGKIINTTNVSNRYEIFDIRSFLKNKILHIESNFNISFYKFIMKRGTQELILLSDNVDINGMTYYKSFFILNSTDKSRKLNMNLGLYRTDNTYFISGLNNMTLCKKHLSGVTKAAEEVSDSIYGETFDEQIESIRSLVGEKVMLSNLRNIIIDKDQKVNHNKFDAFKNQLSYFYVPTNSNSNSMLKLTNSQYNMLRTESKNLNIDSNNDFSIDAYLAFNCYVMIFRNQDSYVVKKETEKILRITQCFIRNEKLSQIFA